jgi:hypothetical protein
MIHGNMRYKIFPGNKKENLVVGRRADTRPLDVSVTTNAVTAVVPLTTVYCPT